MASLVSGWPNMRLVTMLHEAGHASQKIGHLTSSSKAGAKQNFMFDGGGDRYAHDKSQLQRFVQRLIG